MMTTMKMTTRKKRMRRTISMPSVAHICILSAFPQFLVGLAPGKFAALLHQPPSVIQTPQRIQDSRR